MSLPGHPSDEPDWHGQGTMGDGVEHLRRPRQPERYLTECRTGSGRCASDINIFFYGDGGGRTYPRTSLAFCWSPGGTSSTRTWDTPASPRSKSSGAGQHAFAVRFAPVRVHNGSSIAVVLIQLVRRFASTDGVCAHSGRTMEMAEFSKGDKVRWRSHGGQAEGEVIKKITSDTQAAGRTVRASAEEPQYLVRSAKSGGEAVHKPDALEKL